MARLNSEKISCIIEERISSGQEYSYLSAAVSVLDELGIDYAKEGVIKYLSPTLIKKLEIEGQDNNMFKVNEKSANVMDVF